MLHDAKLTTPHDVNRRPANDIGGQGMQWTKPSFTELRLGFEVTMYIFNR
jgi:coenzyme PQQ precursor peptide PqqA